MASIHAYLPRTRIAYFSMEIGLRPDMHTYSGGLGILAGDVARSAADLELPMVFVTLASHQGYLRQEIDGEGRQVEHPDPWDLRKWAMPLGAMTSVALEQRQVWIRPWLYELSCPLGNKVPVILLDTDVEPNDARDRTITDRLYGGNETDRLKQEAVLGIGGERMLRALGFVIETYHLNEGHAALLAASLLRRFPREPIPGSPVQLLYDIDAVRQQCVFTTHTPVEAGHDRFSYEDVGRMLDDFIELDQLKLLGGPDRLDMTRLALNLSGYVNGVARRHAETTRRLFPGYRIGAITNGVHVGQWAHPAIAELFHGILPHWCHEPEVLIRADQLSDEEVWSAHQKAKAELVAEIKTRTEVDMDPSVPIIGFARRMTGYKRPNLLFENLDRLQAIYRQFPFQVVVAGKAHPQDDGGREAIRRIIAHSRSLKGRIPMVFLPNYGMELAARMVAGSDIWLNTPLPPLEASGTSGMKAALNGVLNLSVLDGWWIEAWEEGVTGWGIDSPPGQSTDKEASEVLYDKLQRTVLPLYHQDRSRWIWMMKQAISRIGPLFSSQRMMRRYASEAYLR
jgi:starch phosphorylase